MTTVYEQVVLADSPLRLYPCNDSAAPLADISGHTQNAVISGSPTYGATGLLNSESSTALANTSASYATIPTTGLPTGNSAITLEVWVKATSLPSAYRGVFSVGTQTTGESFNLGVNASNQLYAERKGSSVNGPTATLNGVYHLALTWDGTTLTFYVNGAKQGTATPGAATLTYGAAILDAYSDLTSKPGWTTQYAAIYGAALSQAQVTAHYSAGYAFQIAAPLASGGTLTAQPSALIGAALAGSSTLTAQPSAVIGAAFASGGALTGQPSALIGAALASGGELSAQSSALVSSILASGGKLAVAPLALLVSAALASGGSLSARAGVILPPPAGVSVVLASGPTGAGVARGNGPAGVSVTMR